MTISTITTRKNDHDIHFLLLQNTPATATNLFPLIINDVPPPNNNKYSGASKIIYYQGGIFIERIW